MYVWSALVSFGVIVLGLVRTDRQWTVVAVVAVCALVLLLITLGRPVRRSATRARRCRDSRGRRLAALEGCVPPAAVQRCAVLVFPTQPARCDPRSATWPRTDHEKDCPPMTVDSRPEHAACRPTGRASTSSGPASCCWAARRRAGRHRDLPGRVHHRLRQPRSGLGRHWPRPWCCSSTGSDSTSWCCSPTPERGPC